MRRHTHLIVVGSLFYGATGCKSAHDTELKAEAASVVHAIDALRQAPHDQKDAPLAALGAVTCSDDEVRQLKEQCAQAYSLLVQGLRQVAAIKELDRRDPKALTMEPLDQSERTLRDSRDLMLKCSETEARLKSRFRL